MANLQNVKIFPPIGIARIGNSDEWFISPELPFPAQPPPPPAGKYKDNKCRIKRRAQRFRLWGFFDDGTDRELTRADGAIQWTVHLANAKAVFQGEAGGLIDPGPRTVTGANDSATFANGTYNDGSAIEEVPLGGASTDEDGRLIVVGGFGKSGSPSGKPLSGDFYSNRGWFDDISDGPVNATITVGGTTFTATGAWVICPPPRYAPTTYSPITLYDIIRQAAIDQGLLTPPAGVPSFVKDIWPILVRGIGIMRVAAASFGGGDHGSLTTVIPPGSGQEAARHAIFGRMANPSGGGGDMPLLNASEGPLGSNPQDVPPTLRKFQYDHMQNWSLGNFLDDWPPVAPIVATPDGLTQAALENCVGAPLFPGIEATVTVRDGALKYIEPFRFDQTGMKPGDVTRGMARPWQADFTDCNGGSSRDETAWWPAARPDSVFPAGSATPAEWTRGLVSTPQEMVDNWFRLGFIIDPGDNKPVETERTVVCKNCFIITDRNEIGKEEAQALVNSGQSITDGFYLVVEGFSPNDLGITSASLTSAQLQALFPTAVTLHPKPDEMTVSVTDMLLENIGALNQAQRITFGYTISFTGVSDFSVDVVPITIEADLAGVSNSAIIDLTHQVSPYMDDGPASWLSNDTRVFKLQPNGRFANTNVQLNNDPIAFIQDVLTELRTNLTPEAAFQTFENLPADEDASQLEWLPDLDGQPVYNFALCRVRFRATVTPATDVRVFFRLFQTAATGTDYNSATTYRMGGHPGVLIPLLGVQGGELGTIPFFAEARKPANVNLNQQSDDTNKRTIQPDPGGKEVYMYYGCWLDINNPTDLRFPIQPSPLDGGPFSGTLQSIANLIRGTHQCMVAEIRYDPEPITPGTSAASSDKLAQRNLSIDHSDNPGADTHQVQHSFTIHPTTSNPAPRQGPDELMITWGDTPLGTTATLYLPGVRSADILALAARRFNLQTLERVDDHTIRCKTGHVTYIPVPSGGVLDFAGLITLDLPDNVLAGQIFRIVVRQVQDTPGTFRPDPPVLTAVALGPASRHILGAFQFSVRVQKAAQILPILRRDAISLRRVLATIPVENRWHTVTTRYLDQVATRVRALSDQTDGVGSLRISFIDPAGAIVSDLADIFLKHQVLSDAREVRRWPTDQTLVVRKLISTNSGVYELQALSDHHAAVGRFVTITEGEETSVQLVLSPK